jgi:hypothetical protein
MLVDTMARGVPRGIQYGSIVAPQHVVARSVSSI